MRSEGRRKHTAAAVFGAVGYAVVGKYIGVVGGEEQVSNRFCVRVTTLQVNIEARALFFQCPCKVVLPEEPFSLGNIGRDTVEPVERIVKKAWFQMEGEARACFDDGVVDDNGIADVVYQEVDDAVQYLHVLYQPYLDVPYVEAAEQQSYLLFYVGHVYPFRSVELNIILERKCRHYPESVYPVRLKCLHISKYTGSARRVEAGYA